MSSRGKNEEKGNSEKNSNLSCEHFFSFVILVIKLCFNLIDTKGNNEKEMKSKLDQKLNILSLERKRKEIDFFFFKVITLTGLILIVTFGITLTGERGNKLY